MPAAPRPTSAETEAWYKAATPRKEVREGRSFNPGEFAIALEQVVAGTAPEDYRDPAQFFARTCFTRALREHAGMVLRRLSGRTDSTSLMEFAVTVKADSGGSLATGLQQILQELGLGEAVRVEEGDLTSR